MITARGLARTYKSWRGDAVAVCGVDLDVAERKIVGFLGPGLALRTDPVSVRRRIGYFSQSDSTYPQARSGRPRRCTPWTTFPVAHRTVVARRTRRRDGGSRHDLLRAIYVIFAPPSVIVDGQHGRLDREHAVDAGPPRSGCAGCSTSTP